MEPTKSRDSKDPGGDGRFIVLRVNEAEFGVDITLIKEVLQLMPVSKVPKTPEFVEGVIDLRGSVIPVIDLRKRFGYPQTAYDENARILVVELPEGTIGFIADGVSEIVKLGAGDFREPPRMISGIDAGYIKTLAKTGQRIIIILDLSRVLTESEKKLLRI